MIVGCWLLVVGCRDASNSASVHWLVVVYYSTLREAAQSASTHSPSPHHPITPPPHLPITPSPHTPHLG
ncbi:hypothetical protein [Fischerella thermalis]|uniref:hypothetical protein n=1 Tax=Fischerella thermalis TaxID=372787 RepID=UPI00307F8983